LLLFTFVAVIDWIKQQVQEAKSSHSSCASFF